MMRLMKAFLGLGLSLVLILLLFRGWTERVMKQRYDELQTYQHVSEFELMNQDRETVTRETLLGKVWVADFIFTRCGGPCPEMTRKMKRVQEDVFGPDFHLVSFSVDPEYDTPEKLARYAKKFQADTENWDFLTGDRTQIHSLSKDSFLLGVDKNESEEAAPENFVVHSTKFVLVDKKGKVRGYYDGLEEDGCDRLIQDAQLLLRYG